LALIMLLLKQWSESRINRQLNNGDE